MKYLLIIFLFVVSFFSSLKSYAQLDTSYIYTYGGTNNDYARMIIATNDSGYIIVGTSSSFGVALTDIYIIKTDNNGVKQWSHLYGSPVIDWGYAIRQTYDNGFIVTGYTNQNAVSGYDIYLLKIDSLGNIQWTKTIGGPDWDFGYGIELTSDSGFIICGKSYSFTNGGSDAYIVKTNSTGEIQWEKHYGGPEDESANGIIRDRDNNYAIIGQTRSYGAGDDDIWILKIDENGDTLWTRTYGISLFDAGYAIDTTLDGNYVTNGTTKSFSTDSTSDMIVIKTNSNGNWMWTRIHGDNGSTEDGYVVKCLPNGDIFDGGITDAYGHGKTAYYMIRMDSDANFITSAAFGGTDYEEGYSVAVGKDNQIIFAGISDSYGCGLYDIYLARIDTFAFVNDYDLSIHITCDSTIGIHEITNERNQISIFPNPAYDRVTISLANTPIISTGYKLRISDITGREIQNHSTIIFPAEISVQSLSAGIYMVGIYNEGNLLATGKLIITK